MFEVLLVLMSVAPSASTLPVRTASAQACQQSQNPQAGRGLARVG